MNENQLLLGKRLREIRKQRGLTQEQLGEKLNVSANAIGQFERGMILPNYHTIAKLVRVLEIDANLLFFRKTADYPDEARWIATSFAKLGAAEKRIIGKFLADIARVFLSLDKTRGTDDEDCNLR